MSAERRGEGRGGTERGREGRRGGVSGLFKALVLCLPGALEEGEAHMH